MQKTGTLTVPRVCETMPWAVVQVQTWHGPYVDSYCSIFIKIIVRAWAGWCACGWWSLRPSAAGLPAVAEARWSSGGAGCCSGEGTLHASAGLDPAEAGPPVWEVAERGRQPWSQHWDVTALSAAVPPQWEMEAEVEHGCLMLSLTEQEALNTDNMRAEMDAYREAVPRSEAGTVFSATLQPC